MRGSQPVSGGVFERSWRAGGAVLLLAALTTGCASKQPAPAQAQADGRYDPMNGNYPVVQWMVNVWEADAPLGGGSAGSQRVVEAPQVNATLEAARSLPGASLSSAPCVLANPGQKAGVKVADKDKAGQEVRTVDLSFTATLDKDAVLASVVNNGQEWPAITVPKDAAIVLSQPSRVTPGRWSVVMMRPTVLRSVADYPFQTSSAMGNTR